MSVFLKKHFFTPHQIYNLRSYRYIRKDWLTVLCIGSLTLFLTLYYTDGDIKIYRLFYEYIFKSQFDVIFSHDTWQRLGNAEPLHTVVTWSLSRIIDHQWYMILTSVILKLQKQIEELRSNES